MKKQVLVSLIGALLATTPAMAHQAGDFLIRAGAIGVVPSTSSDIGIDVKNDWQLGLNFDYFITDNIALELIGATPFNHNITLGGVKIAETDQLPPTLLGQYYFGNSKSTIRPYLGIGVNFTNFFNTELNGTGKTLANDLTLSNSWGLAGQVGIDYKLSERWLVNASAMYTQIKTDVKLDGVKVDNLKIDPMVYMFSIGYTF